MPTMGMDDGRAWRKLLFVVLAFTTVWVFACNRSTNPDEADGSSLKEGGAEESASAAAVTQPAASESLRGRIGSSTQWASGWEDLEVMTSFKRGDQLQLRVGGTAHSILVRFLSKGDNPNDPVGIDGGVVKVSEDRVVQVTLEEDHADVVQISVHGGPNPWNLYPLGGDNGPATILSIQRLTPP